MNFEERMFFEAILEQLKTVDQRLTDIESRLDQLSAYAPKEWYPVPLANSSWVCPACGRSQCDCNGTGIPTAAHQWDPNQAPIYGFPTPGLVVPAPVPCDCAPYEYCADCNPEEFKHGPK